MEKKGFTIIEILIAMSIIGALAMLTMPYLAGARFKADRVECISNERNIAQALEMRRNTNPDGKYEVDLDMLVSSGNLKHLPVCPSNNGSYKKNYKVSDEGDRYTITCPGIHYRLLKNMKPGFPQYSSVDGLSVEGN